MEQPITLQGRVTKLFLGVIVLLAIALLLQIVGLATPGWLIMAAGDSKIELGLWVLRLCSNESCVNVKDEIAGDDGFYTIISPDLTEYRVLTIFAFILLALAMVLYCLLFAFIRRGSHIQPLHLKAIVFCTITLACLSGILAIAAAGKFGNHLKKVRGLLKLLMGESPFEVPYSLVLTGIGGGLAVVGALVILFTVQPWKSEAEPLPHVKNTQETPMIGSAPADHKMDT